MSRQRDHLLLSTQTSGLSYRLGQTKEALALTPGVAKKVIPDEFGVYDVSVFSAEQNLLRQYAGRLKT